MTLLRAIYDFIYELFFGCSHGNLTRPFTLQAHSYKVCLDCGRQLPYSLEKMRIFHPWELAKLHTQVTELAPISIASGFAEDEDYRSSKAVA